MNMRKTALLMLAASLSQGCAPNGPLGAVGAIVTAPITATRHVLLGEDERPGGFPGKSEAEPAPLTSDGRAVGGTSPGDP